MLGRRRERRRVVSAQVSDPATREAIHDAVLASELYDKPLGQYKICESLSGQPFEMGRMMAFTPGWLENESVWLHMSFKYYLELLRAGLYEQYYSDGVRSGVASNAAAANGRSVGPRDLVPKCVPVASFSPRGARRTII